MTALVLDASVAIAWLLPSQATAAADDFLADSNDRTFVAPFVFDWEVRNVLLQAHRDEALIDLYELSLLRLSSFEVAVEPPFSPHDLEPLARRERLSLFDAAYFSLALHRQLELASRDARLLEAAGRAGVQTWDLR